MTESTPGVEEWKKQTSAFDRVQSISNTLSQPRSASYIADEAHVAENTARTHLERLVSLNVLLESDQEGTTVYSPDPLHIRMQTLRDLLESHTHDELLQLKTELQAQLRDWRTEYGVNSPADLRAHAAKTETPSQTRRIKKTASDWELTAYRLSVVEDAIENYAIYNDDYRAAP
jgi:predicted ArsR family transcriptional regulator